MNDVLKYLAEMMSSNWGGYDPDWNIFRYWVTS